MVNSEYQKPHPESRRPITNNSLSVTKIISGGQTGVDRAALDFALANGFQLGGWVPKGRRAEDGKTSKKYPNLKETDSKSYSIRTGLNVRDSDATIIIYAGQLSGGSKLTKDLTLKYNKPSLLMDLKKFGPAEAVAIAKKFLESIDCEVLNIAGPRASEDRTIYNRTMEFLVMLFC